MISAWLRRDDDAITMHPSGMRHVAKAPATAIDATTNHRAHRGQLVGTGGGISIQVEMPPLLCRIA